MHAASAEATLSIGIDDGPPAAPEIVILTAASDTGASQTDHRTRDFTPTLTGTGESGLSVQLYADGTLAGTGMVDATGIYVVTLNSLSEGPHDITATSTDEAGNVSAPSSPLSLVIDVTAPSIAAAPDLVSASDAGLEDDDNLTNDTTPTFQGTGTPGDRVNLYADGTFVGTGVIDSTGHYSVTSSLLAEGHYQITATFVDVAGNEGISSPAVAIDIDSTVPTFFQGTIAHGADFQILAVTLGVGERITASITTPGVLNSLLRLFDASGYEVASNDDTVDPATQQTITDSVLTYRTSQAGVYYVGVSSAANTQYAPFTTPATSGSTSTGDVGDFTLRLDHDVNEAPDFGNSARSLTALSTSSIGTAIGSVIATDPESDVLTYAIDSADPVPFTIDAASGVISVDGALLPYETYLFSVTVTDSFGLSSSTIVTVFAQYHATSGSTGGTSGSTSTTADEALGTYFWGLVTPMMNGGSFTPYGGEDPTSGTGTGTTGTEGTSTDPNSTGSGTVSSAAGGNQALSLSGKFGFRRERYSPGLDLPELGNQGTTYTPTEGNFLTQAMTGFTRASHGNITAHTDTTNTGDTQIWQADGGTYVEVWVKTTSVFEEGWELDQTWNYETLVTSTYAYTTTFTDGLGVTFTLLQSGSTVQNYHTANSADPTNGPNAFVENWSFTSTAYDHYTFSLGVNVSQTLTNGDLAAVTGTYTAFGNQTQTVDSGSGMSSGPNAPVISTVPQPQQITLVAEDFDAGFTATLTRGQKTLLNDTIDLGGDYHWKKEVERYYDVQTREPISETMVYDTGTNSDFQFTSLTDWQESTTKLSTLANGNTVVVQLDLNLLMSYQLQADDHFTYHLEGATIPSSLAPAETETHWFTGNGSVEEDFSDDSYFHIRTSTPTNSAAFWMDDDSNSHTRLDYTEHGPGYQYTETGSSAYDTDMTVGIDLKANSNDLNSRFTSITHTTGTNVDATTHPDGDTWSLIDTRTMTKSAHSIDLLATTTYLASGWNEYMVDNSTEFRVTDTYSDPNEVLWLRDLTLSSVSGEEDWTSSSVATVNASTDSLAHTTSFAVVIDTQDTTTSPVAEVSSLLISSSSKIHHKKDNVQVELEAGTTSHAPEELRTWNGTASTHTNIVIDATRVDVDGDGIASEDEATLTTSFHDSHNVTFTSRAFLQHRRP